MLRYFFRLIVLAFFGVLCLNSCSHNGKINAVVWGNGKDFEVKNGLMHHDENLFSGKIVRCYSDDQVQSNTSYVDGKIQGKFDSWYADGSKFEERVFTKGLKTGVHKGWWANGQKKFIYKFNDKGQYQGELFEWRENGEVYKIMNYENGKEAGHQRIWDADGNIKCNYTAINGDRFGLVNMKSCYSVNNEANEIDM